MKRNITIASALAAIGLASIGLVSLPGQARAETASASAQPARAAQPSDLSAQRRNRPPTRLRVYPRYAPDSYGVYPRYFPGRNAVRDCTATYVEEYRPSGTVIVPRMNCFWRRG